MSALAPTPVLYAPISASSSGDNSIIAANATKRFRILALFIMASAAVNARFESGAGGTALTGLGYPAANGGWVLPFSEVGWFETLAINTLLNLELSGAVAVGGCLVYQEIN